MSTESFERRRLRVSANPAVLQDIDNDKILLALLPANARLGSDLREIHQYEIAAEAGREFA